MTDTWSTKCSNLDPLGGTFQPTLVFLFWNKGVDKSWQDTTCAREYSVETGTSGSCRLLTLGVSLYFFRERSPEEERPQDLSRQGLGKGRDQSHCQTPRLLSCLQICSTVESSRVPYRPASCISFCPLTASWVSTVRSKPCGDAVGFNLEVLGFPLVSSRADPARQRSKHRGNLKHCSSRIWLCLKPLPLESFCHYRSQWVPICSQSHFGL